MKKERLDSFLTEHGFFSSREQAKKSILAGLVRIDNVPHTKAGEQIDLDLNPDRIFIKGQLCPYVSRGGFKLEKGLRVFDFPTEGLVFADVGASTGGFTDCLLQNGAARVYSIDVGYGQLDWKLRSDDRVVNLERTNFRNLEPGVIPEQVDGSVMDVSFISITKLLPKLREIMKPGAPGIWLIKPQFEAGREKVGKHGVVRDPAVHREVLEKTTAAVQQAGFTVIGLDRSPIKGPSGNIEFLCRVENTPCENPADFSDRIREIADPGYTEPVPEEEGR
ncbi:MAG: TlyA family RNA methyltransferase [Eubacteriaceae bacterium]|jgi:23S rRNA (cytidine1920-2'-O)/16S rRNA (cytidine1409-2'-O)-methyltransferase